METRKVWLYIQRLHALMHGIAVTPTHKTSAISASMISDNESRHLQSHEGRARSTTRTESGLLCHGRRLLSVTARPVLTGAVVARNPSIVVPAERLQRLLRRPRVPRTAMRRPRSPLSRDLMQRES